MSEKTAGEQYDEAETARRYKVTLARVLATPPDHKTKAKPGASPKKRGRPPKESGSPKTPPMVQTKRLMIAANAQRQAATLTFTSTLTLQVVLIARPIGSRRRNPFGEAFTSRVAI